MRAKFDGPSARERDDHCDRNERKDENRDVGLGPSHDWSSHGADSFGLMAIHYEEPSRMKNFNRPLHYQPLGIV